MRHPLAPSLAKVFGRDGGPEGVAFLVTDRSLLTCAHVVSSALGVPDGTDVPAGATVEVQFAYAGDPVRRPARVERWQRFWDTSRADDLALLSLVGDPPPVLRPARLVLPDDLRGHAYEVFGYPCGVDQGEFSRGEILYAVEDGLIQVEDTKMTGCRLQPGFSGAPVWDVRLQAVVGVVALAQRDPSARVAFIISCDAVRQRIDDVPAQQITVSQASAVAPVNERKLVGRDDAHGRMRAELLAGARPRFAVFGNPGVGKTAFAAALAADPLIVEHFGGRIFWVAVGKNPDDLTILGKWAEALTVGSVGETLLDVRERASQIMKKGKELQSSGSRVLFIADDVWSLDKASLLAEAAGECPLIITTRQRMVAARYGTRDDELKELDPPPEGLKLLEQLAPGVSAADRDGALSLVEAVDGLPLALTLVGGYLQVHALSGNSRRIATAVRKVRDVIKAAGRLPDVQAREDLLTHITAKLRALFKISADALSPGARQVLRSIWVFPPKPYSFSHEAALRVAGAGASSQTEVGDDHIHELADAGLLENCASDRYAVHQMTADFATGEDRDLAAEAEYVKYFVEHIKGNARAYDVLYQDYHNLLKALQAASRPEMRMQRELVDGFNNLFPFLETRGLYAQPPVADLAHQAEVFAADLAKQSGASKRVLSDHATVLHNRARVAEKRSDYPDGKRLCSEALGRARRAGDRALITRVLLTRGLIENNLANYPAAKADLHEALRLAVVLGDGELRCRIVQRLGDVAFNEGKFPEALRYSNEGLELAEGMADGERISAMLLNRAVVRAALGQCDEARADLDRARPMAERIGHAERTIGIHHAEGVVAARCGRWDDAEKSLRDGREKAIQIKHAWYLSAIESEWGEVLLARKKPHDALECFRRAASHAGTAVDLLAHANYGIARSLVRGWPRGDRRTALDMAGRALKDLEAIGHRRAGEVKKWCQRLQRPALRTCAQPGSGPDGLPGIDASKRNPNFRRASDARERGGRLA